MIDKRLLASVPETKRYIVCNIIGQWIALLANVVMMFMIARAIVKLMITVTILMMIGFIMMHKVFIGQIILGLVWLFHIIYFLFGIKTIKVIDR